MRQSKKIHLFIRCLFHAPAGTEELGHLEMIGAIVHQLTRNMKDNQMKDPAFAPFFVDHTAGVYPAAASGTPWSAATMQVKGDPMADLVEDLAADATAEYRRLHLYAERRKQSEKLLHSKDFSGFAMLQKMEFPWQHG